jgi:alpha-glucoside transport system substrate-binding protein
MKTKRFFWALIALLIVGSLVLSACGGAKETAAVEEPAAVGPMDGTYYERAMAGEFAGTVVTMTGPFTDEDAVKFDSSVAAFEEATGIDIQYEGSKEFEATITLRVDAGDAPDIVDFPQPGLLATMVARGAVVDVSTFLPQSSFDNYNQSWWDMATMAGPDGDIIAGVWHRFNAKSQVWYPQAQFEAAGYTIPETWDEMIALSDQIVADGDTPWCVGIESGAATGWPATDWMEEIMLRTTSLENYDAWVRGDLPFSSPEVKHALEVLADLWKDEYVYGGSEAIVTTFFGDAPTPMFEDPPKCWLHKQGNFITSFFPEGVQYGTDYGFFYLPGIDEAYGSPYLVAGDIMAMFSDRDEVRAVMEFFTHGEALKEWLAAGGALAMQLDTDLNWYSDEVERGIAELVNNATSVRFDGSDLMPGEVGSGSFWTGMTDFFSGVADEDTVLAEIDASWPLKVAEGDLGSETNPIQVLFVPSVDANIIVTGGEIMADALSAATGLSFEVSVPTSYAATIEEMCASPDKSMGFIPGLGYALASQLCGVDVSFKAIRYGYPVYWAEYIVARDSDFQTLEDLEGASWGYPYRASTSGYMVPYVELTELGVKWGDEIETGGHNQTVTAVYNNEVDFGTVFYSVPLTPDGPPLFTWDEYLAGDITTLDQYLPPADVVPNCALNEDGSKLLCDGYRILDARANIRTEAPDVIQKVRVLAISQIVPNDTLAFGPDFPADVRAKVESALLSFADTEEWSASIGNNDFYGWTGIEPATDAEYDVVRQMVIQTGYELEE